MDDRPQKTAILIGGLTWECDGVDSIEVSKHISFQRFTATRIETLYHQLCEDVLFHEGVPDHIEAVVLIDGEALDELSPYWNTPNSIISEICNIVAICTKCPPTTYCIISSKDDFITNWGVPIEIHYRFDLYETLTSTIDFTPAIEKLLLSVSRNFKHEFNLTPATIDKVRICFSSYLSTDNKRLRNAFNFFFNSWYIDQMEQTCINLAVILETLFSPSENTELNFRIAFNTANFLGRDKMEKENIFKIVKKFYSIRSKIVHGGHANFEDVYIFSGVVFLLCAETLEKLGLDHELSSLFSDDKKREKLFNGWMFS